MPVFCITADYTPDALKAMRANPDTNRRAAAEEMCAASGGKLIAMYGTMTNGPGVLVIYETPDLSSGPAIAGVVKSSGAVENFKLTRLFDQDEIKGFRGRARELESAYNPPGQR